LKPEIWNAQSVCGHIIILYECGISFQGAFAKLRKATINFVMSVLPPVLMKHLGSHGTDFREIWYFSILRKFFEKIQVSLFSYKNNGYFA